VSSATHDAVGRAALERGSAARLWTSFDFLMGSWRVENRKLRTLLPEEERTGWFEFESTAEARRILGGAGVMDAYSMPDFPGRPRNGFALRLVDPKTDRWTIWWAASSAPGRLDPPVVGGFVNGEGHFSGEDTYAGRRVLVRTQYTDITDASLRWEQAFSFDAGRTFEANWVMQFHRVA
jgi:hypothetical protein